MLIEKKGPILPKKIKHDGCKFIKSKVYYSDKYNCNVELYKSDHQHDPFYLVFYLDRKVELAYGELDKFIDLVFGGIKK